MSSKYFESLKNHQISLHHGFSQKVNLISSENEYFTYPVVGVLVAQEQGTDLSIIQAVFHKLEDDGSLGAPAVVKKPIFQSFISPQPTATEDKSILNKWVKDLSGIKGLVTDVSAFPLVTVSFPDGGGTRFLRAEQLTIVTEDKSIEQMAKQMLADYSQNFKKGLDAGREEKADVAGYIAIKVAVEMYKANTVNAELQKSHNDLLEALKAIDNILSVRTDDTALNY